MAGDGKMSYASMATKGNEAEKDSSKSEKNNAASNASVREGSEI